MNLFKGNFLVVFILCHPELASGSFYLKEVKNNG